MDTRVLLEHIAGIKDNLQKYVETKVSYYGMLAFEKSVRMLGLFMAHVVVLMIGLLALLFLSGAAAVLLGDVLDSSWMGLLIVGGFYLLIGLFVFARRRSIFGRWAIRSLVHLFFSEDDEENSERKKS